MFHDDLFEKIKATLDYEPKNSVKGAAFFRLFLESKPNVFYFKQEDVDKDLIETGMEFYDNGILEQPFDSVMYVIDVLLPDGEKTKVGMVYLKIPEKPNFRFLWLCTLGYKSHFLFQLSDQEMTQFLEGNFLNVGVGLVEKNDNPKRFMDENKPILTEHITDLLRMFFGCTMLLNTKYAVTDRAEISDKLNKKRKKTGKPLLLPYTTISLRTRAAGGPGLGGTHSSPRPHWRRGHIRRYADGHVIPIAPILVNADLGEAAQKAYKVRK